MRPLHGTIRCAAWRRAKSGHTQRNLSLRPSTAFLRARKLLLRFWFVIAVVRFWAYNGVDGLMEWCPFPVADFRHSRWRLGCLFFYQVYARVGMLVNRLLSTVVILI